MSTEPRATFGDLLRHARRTAALTQEALAERAGISVRAISDLERGVNRAPQPETLRLLADALELPPDERRQWHAARRRLVTRGSHENGHATTSRGKPSNAYLPAPLNSFVGRERETTEVAALLSQPNVRIVTLTGPGGVGKTRLALAIGRRLHGQYRDGIWFVNLAPISDPDLVLSTTATTLGIPVSGQEPALTRLISALRNSRRLLILDNFEQVAVAARELPSLLGACPNLFLLTTSRIPLRIQGEHEYAVEPLGLPDDAHFEDIEQLRRSESVDLFEQRARAITAGFRITEHNAPAVAGICQQLDGLPLAIELAAARTRLLSPRALLVRLERRLPLLTDAPHDVPERQQTLRNTIAWSYDLLDPEQQSLFRALSVFRGGWTFEAAEDVGGGPSDAKDPVGLPSALEALIANNLVRVREQPDGEPRYTMLETIAEFARDRLDESEEAQERHQRHADFVLALVEQAEGHFRGPEQEDWMAVLEVEHANVRAALGWIRERAQDGDTQATERGLRMAAAAWWFWYVHGHHREAREFLSPLIHMYREQVKTDTSLAESPEAAIAYVRSIFALVTLSYWTADIELFDELLRESHAISQRFGQRHEFANSLLFSGFLAGHVGRFREAKGLFEQARAAFQEQGGIGNTALVGLGMGEMWLRQREYELAAAILTESLDQFVRLEDTRAIAAARATLGAVRVGQRQLTEGRKLLAASLRARFEIGDKGGIAWCLERMAELALLDTSPPDSPPMRAARLLGTAKQLRDAIDSPVDPVDQPEIARLTDLAKDQLSDQAFIAAWEAGRSMALEDAVAYALAPDPGRAGQPAATL